MIYGIGTNARGKYKSRFNDRPSKEYTCWRDMIRRCYDPLIQEKYPTYKGCSVAEVWHEYQTYAEWYLEHPYNNADNLHLDKDLLIKGNKVYDPENCVFLPHELNCLLITGKLNRGELPIGVRLSDSKKNPYRANFSRYVNGKQSCFSLGYYSNPEDAFYAYKEAKEDYIKVQARQWYGKIEPKAYDALMGYEVHIDD